MPSPGPSPSSSSPSPAPRLDERGLPVGYPFQPDWEVTPRDVKRGMDAGEYAGPDGVLLLDCRRADEWAIAKIEGAVLVPMDQIGGRLTELEGKTTGRERVIVVQCHTGRRSLRVAAALRQAGFSDVKSMAGGIEAWSVDIDPRVARY
jgi:rhodanese-related sulfurtransferase